MRALARDRHEERALVVGEVVLGAEREHEPADRAVTGDQRKTRARDLLLLGLGLADVMVGLRERGDVLGAARDPHRRRRANRERERRITAERHAAKPPARLDADPVHELERPLVFDEPQRADPTADRGNTFLDDDARDFAL